MNTKIKRAIIALVSVLLISAHFSALYFFPYGQADAKWNITNKLVSLWIQEDIAKVVVKECKKQTKDPRHCVEMLSSILWSESSGGNQCNANNCTGMQWWSRVYKTKTEGIKDWIQIYNKYWYKAEWMSFFYSPRWQLPKSRYCTSEYSSNSKIWCPNGLKNSSEFLKKIRK